MTGKWRNNMGDALDIISDGGERRVKFSFSATGEFNVTPTFVFDGDDLTFSAELQGTPLTFVLTFASGAWSGKLKAGGQEIPLKYDKISDAPEDDDYRVENPNEYYKGKKRADILREHADFEPLPNEEAFTNAYELNKPVPDALNAYGYKAAADGKTGDGLAFAIMSFISRTFHHDGSSGLPESARTLEGLIDFAKERGEMVNCRGLSILLASALRSSGIKASHVTCLPVGENEPDCHVTVDCALPSGKRIMFDPTYNLYFTDEAGEYVSIRRLREILIDGGKLTPNKEAGYRAVIGKIDPNEYRAYMTKNTFRFQKPANVYDGCDFDRQPLLVPKGYESREAYKAIFTGDANKFWQA